MCILIVEDEAAIRLILAEALGEAGFNVYTAENGDQAALLIEAPPAPPHLLITDIHMPGKLDGFAVADLMRARHPRVPIIYTTGRHDAFKSMGRLREREALVLKPYTSSDLLRVIRRLVPNDLAVREG